MQDQPSLSNAKTLEEFDVDLKQLHIRGQWQYDKMLEQVIKGPRPAGIPFIWHWKDVREKLLESCQVMPESFTARRNLSFINPGLERGGTTQTLLMGFQIVMPGEIAWAHRHTIGALRFVVDGSSDLYTAVDGEKLTMETNDLVLTPNWTWHDHHNDSDKKCMWLDVLDVPIVIGMNQIFYEPYGQSMQPVREKREDYLAHRGGPLRPAWETRSAQNFPYRYAWSEISPILDEFMKTAGTPYDGVMLEYVNPMTGGPTLPDMSCVLVGLKPGHETKETRKTSSAVFHVVEGEGTTIAGDTQIHWSEKDSFVVPNWTHYRHINRSNRNRAVLFSVTDEPFLSGLGLYRQEPENTLRRLSLPPVPANSRGG